MIPTRPIGNVVTVSIDITLYATITTVVMFAKVSRYSSNRFGGPTADQNAKRAASKG